MPVLVFVHIGRELPAHLPVAARQAALFNRTGPAGEGEAVPILIVAPAEALAGLPPMPGVRAVPCESLPVSAAHAAFRATTGLDRTFRNGFWTYATERFYYLAALASAHGLEDIYHLENDNLLYLDLEEVNETVRRHYPGIAATFDCDTRCIPGFIYFSGAPALAHLTAFLTELHAKAPSAVNDMQALGLYRQAFGPAHIDCLPVITPDYPRPLGNRLGQIPRSREEYFKHFDEFRSVFDAAALGQYLGGCDTAGRPAGEHGAGFINETAVFDPSAYGYCTALDGQGRRLYYLRTPAGLCRINNLHIHSKNLHPFTSGPAR